MPETENRHIELQKLSLPVEGMTCASCVAREEKAIKKVDGVKNVSVNLATEKATFEFDDSRINIKEIAGMVEDAGYKMKVESPDQNKKDTHESDYESEEKSEYNKQLWKDFIFAVILTIPIFILSMSAMWGGFNNLINISPDYLNKIHFREKILQNFLE